MKWFMLALFVSASLACTPQLASKDKLLKRASFDMDCPESSLEVVEIDDRTRGVKGCDQRATYVETCKPCANGYVGCECTWLLNTDGRSN